MKSIYSYFRITVFFITLFCSVPSLFSQENQSPFLTDEELDGGETTRFNVFDGNSLWGYINGGADIYLEYGFEQVLVQEISHKENNYKIEIYRMIDMESAYGIFSVSTFRCLDDNPQNIDHYCGTNYQIQFALAESYVSITNESGNDEGRIYIRYLASIIESRTEQMNFTLPVLFQHELFNTYIGSMKLMKGNLGLQNGFAFWSGRFDFPDNFKILLLPIRMDEGEVNVAILEFKSPEEREKFYSQNNMLSGKAATGMTWYYGTTSILFFETSLSEEDSIQYVQILEEFLTN